jgi:hypothetical protein
VSASSDVRRTISNRSTKLRKETIALGLQSSGIMVRGRGSTRRVGELPPALRRSNRQGASHRALRILSYLLNCGAQGGRPVAAGGPCSGSERRDEPHNHASRCRDGCWGRFRSGVRRSSRCSARLGRRSGLQRRCGRKGGSNARSWRYGAGRHAEHRRCWGDERRDHCRDDERWEHCCRRRIE